jgi:hypothetical protein
LRACTRVGPCVAHGEEASDRRQAAATTIARLDSKQDSARTQSGDIIRSIAVLLPPVPSLASEPFRRLSQSPPDNGSKCKACTANVLTESLNRCAASQLQATGDHGTIEPATGSAAEHKMHQRDLRSLLRRNQTRWNASRGTGRASSRLHSLPTPTARGEHADPGRLAQSS